MMNSLFTVRCFFFLLLFVVSSLSLGYATSSTKFGEIQPASFSQVASVGKSSASDFSIKSGAVLSEESRIVPSSDFSTSSVKNEGLTIKDSSSSLTSALGLLSSAVPFLENFARAVFGFFSGLFTDDASDTFLTNI